MEMGMVPQLIITLTMDLYLQGMAEGDLYLDDGLTSAATREGKFSLRRFRYESSVRHDNIIPLSTWTLQMCVLIMCVCVCVFQVLSSTGSSAFDMENTVERIVLCGSGMGVLSSVTRRFSSNVGAEAKQLEFQQQAHPGVITVRLPNVLIHRDFQIEFVFA